MTERYDSDLAIHSCRAGFDAPPKCHYSHHDELEDAILDVKGVANVWLDQACAVEINYETEAALRETIRAVDDVLQSFNAAKYLKALPGW